MINENLLKLAEKAEKEIAPVFNRMKKTSSKNHAKILDAFRLSGLSSHHLLGTTGYGYNDIGRDKVEEIYARVFNTEAALVRGQIMTGTHAIALVLYGLLRPGDELLSITGKPYDTLETMIGANNSCPGSLVDYGIKYRQVNLQPDGTFNLKEISSALNEKTRLVYIQRSRGYTWRPSIHLNEIRLACEIIKNKRPEIVIFVDNCYGELVEEKEPTEVGADMAAGSLIKNLGGGIAPTGGYIVGKKELVELAANRLTAPGIGGEVGASLNFNGYFLQGLFYAPLVVNQALMGSVFAASLFKKLGFAVSPEPDEDRSDIIQAIKLGSRDLLIAFCKGIQEGSPVDSHVAPEPWGMPGYDDEVIMAAGTFVQGASIELSADGPIRPPYAVYFQGGLSYEYTKIAILNAAKKCLAVMNCL